MTKHNDKKREHAGVVFPPPLLFILGFAISLLAHKFLPLYLIPDTLRGIFSIIGRLFTLTGLAFMIWGLLTFHRFSHGDLSQPTRITSRHGWTVSIQPKPDVCWFYHSLHWWHFNKKYTLGALAASPGSLASVSDGDSTRRTVSNASFWIGVHRLCQ